MRIYFFIFFTLGFALLFGCGGKKRAEAIKQPDPSIRGMDTNEVVGIDFRSKLKENREKQSSAASMDILVDGIQRFQEEMGRVPSNLVELVEMQFLEKIPDPPVGVKYVYKNEHGQVLEAYSDGKPTESEVKDSAEATTFIGQ